jgi:hypothetical protein
MLRNTKPHVASLYTIWRTWHGSMSVIPSLEYFYHQKVDLFEFAIHYKVLDLIFLKMIRDSSDTKKGLATVLRPPFNPQRNRRVFYSSQLDIHGSVYRDIIMNTTNEMQLYRLIYYS